MHQPMYAEWKEACDSKCCVQGLNMHIDEGRLHTAIALHQRKPPEGITAPMKPFSLPPRHVYAPCASRWGWFLLLGALLGWLIVIYCFSAQDATASSKLSSSFLERLLLLFSRTPNAVSRSALHQFVRTLGHFGEFFLLGVFSTLSLLTSPVRRIPCRWGLLSLPFCMLMAAADEVHQHFVPGRAMELADFLVDSAGAALAVLLVVVLCLYLPRRESSHAC